MKAPLSWLQDFVEINVDMDTLTRTMIMHGLGVEGIERVYGAYDSIVIGKLLRIVPHENSDHLQICTVTTGDENAANRNRRAQCLRRHGVPGGQGGHRDCPRAPKLNRPCCAACPLPACFAAAKNWN